MVTAAADKNVIADRAVEDERQARKRFKSHFKLYYYELLSKRKWLR
jgi:hypothetical protein